MEEEKFINAIKKVSGPRVHKINNSYGVYDYYKYYRKTKPKDKKYVLTESQYFKIIREINALLVEDFLQGNDITLPHKMGRLELRKVKSTIKLEGSKVKTNLPIDWNRTLKLWYEDPECFKNKTLVKIPEVELYKIYYNKTKANFINKSFYQFTANRDFKLALKHAIRDDGLDAFTF